jgi:hypothetical protein
MSRHPSGWGDYTKVTYLHAKREQIRYNASRDYLWVLNGVFNLSFEHVSIIAGADMGGPQAGSPTIEVEPCSPNM